MTQIVSVRSPVNIALVKYWGKADQINIYPINSSLSLTLDTNSIHSDTQISVNPPSFHENLFYLNGKETPFNRRMRDVFLLAKLLSKLEGKSIEISSITVQSRNSFPTGCGIASSASGMSAYAFSLCRLFGLNTDKYASLLARRGSGSACRSTLGGIVIWDHVKVDPENCIIQLYDASYWPELRVILCVVDDKTKKNASTGGMQDSMRSSAFMKLSRCKIAAENLESIIDAIEMKNFSKFAQIIMQESNQLHAMCLDTYPPIKYLNESSWTIIKLVTVINQHFGHPVVAYTFDAGPNAFLVCLEERVKLVLSCLSKIFPQSEGTLHDGDIEENILSELPQQRNSGLDRVYVNKLGPGTQFIQPE